MKIAIILNADRVTPLLKEKLESNQLREKFEVDYDLFITQPHDLESVLNNLAFDTYSACLVGGGDGTVRTAAQALMNYEIPLAILPLGTFNVLAKSLHYTNDIEELFAIIKNKKTKKIDIAEVNEKVFVNHAWLGFYYNLLKTRKKHEGFLGRSRLLKGVFATLFILKKLPIFEFKIKIDGVVTNYKTILMFISNNETSNEFLNFGNRPLLATGLLHVNILNVHTSWQFFICMISLIFMHPKDSKYVSHFEVDELTVSTTSDQVNIVLDGESLKLKQPLHFKNLKNKLTVIVP